MINLLAEQQMLQLSNYKINNSEKEKWLRNMQPYHLNNQNYQKEYNGFLIDQILFNIKNIYTNDCKMLIQIPKEKLQEKNNIFLLEARFANNGDFDHHYMKKLMNYFLNSIDDKYTIVENNEGMQLQITEYNKNIQNNYLLCINKQYISFYYLNNDLWYSKEMQLMYSKEPLLSDNEILKQFYSLQQDSIENFTINNKKVYQNFVTSDNTLHTEHIIPHVNFRVFQLLSEEEIGQNQIPPYKNDKFSIIIEGKKYYLYSVFYYLLLYDNSHYNINDIISKKKNIIISEKAIIVEKINKSINVIKKNKIQICINHEQEEEQQLTDQQQQQIQDQQQAIQKESKIIQEPQEEHEIIERKARELTIAMFLSLLEGCHHGCWNNSQIDQDRQNLILFLYLSAGHTYHITISYSRDNLIFWAIIKLINEREQLYNDKQYFDALMAIIESDNAFIGLWKHFDAIIEQTMAHLSCKKLKEKNLLFDEKVKNLINQKIQNIEEEKKINEYIDNQFQKNKSIYTFDSIADLENYIDQRLQKPQEIDPKKQKQQEINSLNQQQIQEQEKQQQELQKQIQDQQQEQSKEKQQQELQKQILDLPAEAEQQIQEEEEQQLTDQQQQQIQDQQQAIQKESKIIQEPQEEHEIIERKARELTIEMFLSLLHGYSYEHLNNNNKIKIPGNMSNFFLHLHLKKPNHHNKTTSYSYDYYNDANRIVLWAIIKLINEREQLYNDKQYFDALMAIIESNNAFIGLWKHFDAIIEQTMAHLSCKKLKEKNLLFDEKVKNLINQKIQNIEEEKKINEYIDNQFQKNKSIYTFDSIADLENYIDQRLQKPQEIDPKKQKQQEINSLNQQQIQEQEKQQQELQKQIQDQQQEQSKEKQQQELQKQILDLPAEAEQQIQEEEEQQISNQHLQEEQANNQVQEETQNIKDNINVSLNLQQIQDKQNQQQQKQNSQVLKPETEEEQKQQDQQQQIQVNNQEQLKQQSQQKETSIYKKPLIALIVIIILLLLIYIIYINYYKQPKDIIEEVEENDIDNNVDDNNDIDNND